MEPSILRSTKKILNISPDETSFDLDIITHINTAFSVLHDLGVGPSAGFAIEDETTEWSEFLPDEEDLPRLSKVRACVYLRAKLLFDPPTSSYLLDSTQKLLAEQEWRLSVNREESEWIEPDQSEFMIIDGGNPAGA